MKETLQSLNLNCYSRIGNTLLCIGLLWKLNKNVNIYSLKKEPLNKLFFFSIQIQPFQYNDNIHCIYILSWVFWRKHDNHSIWIVTQGFETCENACWDDGTIETWPFKNLYHTKGLQLMKEKPTYTQTYHPLRLQTYAYTPLRSIFLTIGFLCNTFSLANYL